jgi:uncharacterized membrane protein (UPF0127 family)
MAHEIQFLSLTSGGILLADRIVLCDDMESRHIGLLGRDQLALNEGILMTMPWPRSGGSGLLTSIHMVGMKFPIVVAWVTRDHIVADVKIAKPGGLMYGTWRAASFILEAHTDHLSALAKGSRLDWTSIS